MKLVQYRPCFATDLYYKTDAHTRLFFRKKWKNEKKKFEKVKDVLRGNLNRGQNSSSPNFI